MGDTPDNSMDPGVSVAMQLATTEVQVIWRRYAGFLVLHGFIIHGLVPLPAASLVGAATAAAGLLSCCVWYILNFSGWLNQNVFMAWAYVLMPPRLRETCPWAAQYDGRSDMSVFRAVGRPSGTIYLLAQVAPAVAAVTYTVVVIGLVARHVHEWVAAEVFVAGAYCAIAILASYAITRLVYRRKKLA